MSVIVQKYGGTSVCDPRQIQQAACIVKRAFDKGDFPVVVISAMAGVTNQLARWVHELESKSKKELSEYDLVVSSGEQVTSGLMALALQNLGLDARSWMGWQIPILTNEAHGNADILSINGDTLQNEINNHRIPVIAGFQGINAQNKITTLGRGGSDITAVAIAASLQAKVCQIYTDVDGVYTADPRLVAEAKRFSILSYEDMKSLAQHGAKVLHPRAIELAHMHAVPIQVLSTFCNEGDGTLIHQTDNRIRCGIAQKQVLQWKIEKIDYPQSKQLKKLFKKKGIFPIQWVNDVKIPNLSFLTWKNEEMLIMKTLKSYNTVSLAHYNVQPVILIALIGNHAKMFYSFSQTNKEFLAKTIPIKGFFYSVFMVGIIIDAQYLKDALNQLHFFLGLHEMF